jgi:hypothetical protein
MMGDTYDSVAEAEADREQQKALHSALGTWDRALQRDHCNAWAIIGKRGSIHTWGDGKSWALYVSCNSGQHWTWAKKKLTFCSLTQDADDEGVLRLDQLPMPDQAEAIRDALGIQKRREVSAGVLERLRSFAFGRKPRNEATLEQNIGLGGRPPSDAYPDQTPALDAEPAS